LLRSQNELAEQRKAIQAEREAADKARKDYEAKLPALMQALSDANAGAFSDIRTIDDVTKLAQEDPFRYLQWQAHQSKMAAVQQEMDRANQAKEAEKQASWSKHVQDESQRFAESLSEADQKRLDALNKAAPDFLKERGFSQQELTDLAQGKERLSIWDHRVQSLILDGMKYRDAQKAPQAVRKPVPPVQRPGTAAPRGATQAASIQALNQRLSETGKLDDAMALWQARRASKG
jgi:myosin heavy subunit